MPARCGTKIHVVVPGLLIAFRILTLHATWPKAPDGEGSGGLSCWQVCVIEFANKKKAFSIRSENIVEFAFVMMMMDLFATLAAALWIPFTWTAEKEFQS